MFDNVFFTHLLCLNRQAFKVVLHFKIEKRNNDQYFTKKIFLMNKRQLLFYYKTFTHIPDTESSHNNKAFCI